LPGRQALPGKDTIMFSPVSQYLNELMMFFILGFLLAALYEPLRISRHLINTNAVLTGIEDFLFLLFCGVITFAYSLELSSGEFRIFFLFGEFLGAAVYFITLGRVISFISETFSNALKTVIKYTGNFIYRRMLLPVWKLLVNVTQKINSKTVIIYKIIKKHAILLKNNAKVKYNSITSNSGKSANSRSEKKKGGVNNVIKAKVRKA
jgi:hypothetical protein